MQHIHTATKHTPYLNTPISIKSLTHRISIITTHCVKLFLKFNFLNDEFQNSKRILNYISEKKRLHCEDNAAVPKQTWFLTQAVKASLRPNRNGSITHPLNTTAHRDLTRLHNLQA